MVTGFKKIIMTKKEILLENNEMLKELLSNKSIGGGGIKDPKKSIGGGGIKDPKG
tara:strand:+ start:27139 stop:27303 length:165 start_codon:yes stop_codon:yes gene_type:complete